MNLKEAKAAIECLLFVSAEPVQAKKIAAAIELDEKTVQILTRELAEEYHSRFSGLQILETAGGFMLTTKKEYGEIVAKFCSAPPPPGLSVAALETLSIIAYKQPITKTEIEAIRGVKIDRALATLQERDLIFEMGRKETIGRPILYGTTQEFLRYLGLKDLSELPPLDGIPADASSGPEINPTAQPLVENIFTSKKN